MISQERTHWRLCTGREVPQWHRRETSALDACCIANVRAGWIKPPGRRTTLQRSVPMQMPSAAGHEVRIEDDWPDAVSRSETVIRRRTMWRRFWPCGPPLWFREFVFRKAGSLAFRGLRPSLLAPSRSSGRKETHRVTALPPGWDPVPARRLTRIFVRIDPPGRRVRPKAGPLNPPS